MILVDDRIGSADLMGHLRHWGVPCELTRLEYGDACFDGCGPDGPIYIGVEIKKIHDALQCMGDGRFAGHQLPGLIQSYDRIWVVVEGNWYPNFSDGILRMAGRSGKTREVGFGNRRFMYRDIDHWLTTMEVRAGIRVRRTRDRIETARVVADLASWWSKDWGDHRGHLALHEDQPDGAILIKPSLCRKVAAQLPGIGWKRSGDVAAKFKTVQAMVAAQTIDWESIPGIGSGIAEKVWNALRQR
jgi:ERCC4-type nuclease